MPAAGACPGAGRCEPSNDSSNTREKLSSAISGGRVVTAGIRKAIPGLEDRRREGLPTGHAYSVIGYDRATDTITLRNPWGRTELTNRDGQPRDGGTTACCG